MDNYIFDFDGVILDSTSIKTEGFKYTVRNYSPQIQRKFMEFHSKNEGVSRSIKFKYLVNELLKSNDKFLEQKLSEEFEHKILHSINECSFIQGSIELIRLLKKQGKRLFIISGTPQEELNTIVINRNIDHYFLEVIGSPPNKIDSTARVIQKYMLNPKQTLFIGDAKTDLDAAIENNLNFYAIKKKSNEVIFKDEKGSDSLEQLYFESKKGNQV